MRSYSPVTATIFTSWLMLIPWLLPGFSLAASQVIQEAVSSPSTQGLEKIADGNGGDTLTACLARVPKDASASQRLLAVDSCKQEEVIRILSRIFS